MRRPDPKPWPAWVNAVAFAVVLLVTGIRW